MKAEIYLRSKESSDPAYGYNPWERPINLLMRYGVVNLDKPRGPTSHQVVAWAKEILRVEKAGHGGTLDPKVSGVLPVALERATRVLRYIQGLDKTYVFVMTLHGDISDAKIRKVVDEFSGPIIQTPPMKSAVKREARVRTIRRLELLERAGRDLLFKVECEAGTYIRKLCRDMGEAMLVGANMSELRRMRSGVFREEESCTLQDLVDAVYFYREGDDHEIRRLIRPVEAYIDGLPKIWVRDTAVEALCNGAPLAAPGIVKCESTVEAGEQVAALTLKGELIGIGEAKMSAKAIFSADSGIAASLSRVVMERGLYPRYWKKGTDGRQK